VSWLLRVLDCGYFFRTTQTSAHHSQHKRCWRNAFDLHLHCAGQAMLQGNAARRIGIHREFDANPSVAHFTANMSDRGADAAVFGPGKSIQPQTSWLPGLNAAQGIGGLKARHNSQVPRRYHSGEFLALSPNTAHAHIGDFAKPAVDRSTDESPVHFIFQALDRSLGRRLAASQAVDLALETFEVRSPILCVG